MSSSTLPGCTDGKTRGPSCSLYYVLNTNYITACITWWWSCQKNRFCSRRTQFSLLTWHWGIYYFNWLRLPSTLIGHENKRWSHFYLKMRSQARSRYLKMFMIYTQKITQPCGHDNTDWHWLSIAGLQDELWLLDSKGFAVAWIFLSFLAFFYFWGLLCFCVHSSPSQPHNQHWLHLLPPSSEVLYLFSN